MYSCSITPDARTFAAPGRARPALLVGDDRGAAAAPAAPPPGRGQLGDERVTFRGSECSRPHPAMSGRMRPRQSARPSSWQSWNIEYLPASRRGRSAGGAGTGTAPQAGSPCSARKMAPASSVGSSTAGRPIRSAEPHQPRASPVRWSGIGPPEEPSGQVAGTGLRVPSALRARRRPGRPAGRGCGSRPDHRGASRWGRTSAPPRGWWCRLTVSSVIIAGPQTTTR